MKTRLQRVMEAHGVTKADIADHLSEYHRVSYAVLHNYINILIKDDSLTGYDTLTIKCLAETCNCSTDYLLGLSENMNPIG